MFPSGPMPNAALGAVANMNTESKYIRRFHSSQTKSWLEDGGEVASNHMHVQNRVQLIQLRRVMIFLCGDFPLEEDSSAPFDCTGADGRGRVLLVMPVMLLLLSPLSAEASARLSNEVTISFCDLFFSVVSFCGP